MDKKHYIKLSSTTDLVVTNHILLYRQLNNWQVTNNDTTQI